MREIVMEWIVNIAIFSLIVSAATKLLPGKNYIPYVRLFAGMVTILLFLNPILSVLGLEKKLSKRISEDLYEVEMAQMETKLIEMEEKQRQRLEQMYLDAMEEQQ